MKSFKLFLSAARVLSAFLFFAVSLPAAPVSFEAAEGVARKHLERGRGGKIKQTVASARHKATAAAPYFVFEKEGGGFIIVSADNVATPILGETFGGAFDRGGMPPALVWLLGNYERQIEEAVKNGAAQDEETKKRWEEAAKGSGLRKAAAGEPLQLLSTAWAQGEPYNLKTPVDPDSGRNSLTGCVATAMAQIMRYWRHPDTGRFESERYYTGTKRILVPPVSFNARYDYGNMLDSYPSASGGTAAQRDAVATLAYHSGVSVKMDYAADESTAYDKSAASALARYFDYDSAGIRYVDSDEFSGWQNDWKELVIGQIENNSPVYYSGKGAAGGAVGTVLDSAYFSISNTYSASGYYTVNHRGVNLTRQFGAGGIPDGNITLQVVTKRGGGAWTPAGETRSVSVSFWDCAEGVTSIGNQAFYELALLASVSIPGSVVSIGESAFYMCNSLASVRFPDSVTSIGYDAFYGCQSLTSVTFPNNAAVTVGYGAFSDCTGLTLIVIPDSAASIKFDTDSGVGGGVFDGCAGLKSIICLSPAPPEKVDNQLFYGVDMSKICLYIPPNGVDTYKSVYCVKEYLCWNEFGCIKPAETYVSIAVADRVIPQTRPPKETVAAAPINRLTAEFAAGPNPAGKSSGAVNFFRQGSRVKPAALLIFDAAGNAVNKIAINDNAAGSNINNRRVVGTWDLKDAKGRPVGAGTYLARGALTAKDGKKEKVSELIFLR
jgi:hypothetical protein